MKIGHFSYYDFKSKDLFILNIWVDAAFGLSAWVASALCGFFSGTLPSWVAFFSGKLFTELLQTVSRCQVLT